MFGYNICLVTIYVWLQYMFGYNIQYVWLQYMSGFRVTVEPDNTVRSFCFSCCRLCFLCREFDYFWHSVLVHTFLLCFVESREQRPSCGLAENSEDFFLSSYLINKNTVGLGQTFLGGGNRYSPSISLSGSTHCNLLHYPQHKFPWKDTHKCCHSCLALFIG